MRLKGKWIRHFALNDQAEIETDLLDKFRATLVAEDNQRAIELFDLYLGNPTEPQFYLKDKLSKKIEFEEIKELDDFCGRYSEDDVFKICIELKANINILIRNQQKLISAYNEGIR